MMIYISFTLYNYHITPFLRSGGYGDLGKLFFIPSIFIQILVIAVTGRIRPFSIGITSLVPSLLLLLFVTINSQFSTIGEYRALKLRCINHYFYQKSTLNLEYNNWHNTTNVSIDKLVRVDTCHVRIDKGLFGVEFMSNDIQIRENRICGQSLDTSLSIIGQIKKFQRFRCFRESINLIDHYLYLGMVDSDLYYERGNSNMVVGNYEHALSDYITSLRLKYPNLNEESVINTDYGVYSAIFQEKLNEYENGNHNALDKITEQFQEQPIIDDYVSRISFCYDRIE